MQEYLKKELARLLRETADRLDTNTSEANDEQTLELINLIAHQPLSREEACNYLNISRNRFNELIDLGKLPKGRKRRGFKELVWYKDELIRK